MRTCPTLAELEAFAEAGGGEADLLAHVEQCPRCESSLSQVRENMALLSEAIRPHRAALVAELGYAGSDAVPGYEILREIHRGGQGVVFEALQRSTQRTVALKVLLAGEFAADERRRRFEREVELVASLRHPNLVTVYDSGFLDDGRPFFAMEYVDGLTLDAFLRARNALPPPDRGPGWTLSDSLRLFAAICGAVEHAHRRGVIHRDLKPGNVLIDVAGVPRVLDFGLAKPVGESSVELTSPAEFLGTLAYASPEQLGGDHLAIDTRTDVWALGVMLFEMVTGRSPHAGADRVAALVTAIETRDPPPPSTVRGRAGLRGAGDELDAIVLRALAKEPERRYPSAGALGREVERLLAGEPVDARRDSTWYVVRKAARRHRGAVAAAAAFLALLVGAVAGMGVLWRSSVRAAGIARHEADGAQAARDFLGEMLLAVDPDLAKGGEPTVREVLDEASRRIEDELSERPALRAEVRRFVGQAYRSIGYLDEARTQLETALSEARSAFGTRSAKAAEVAVELAWVHLDEGAHDRAAEQHLPPAQR
jgi:serine/threonine protein kinase